MVGPGGLPERPLHLKSFSGPIVLDADALTHLRKISYPKSEKRVVLTPHVKEATRLLGLKSIQGVLQNRIEALDALSARYKCSVYLKGAPGLLRIYGDPQIYVCFNVNPVFSKAGSGDILSGILGGFLAQQPVHVEPALLSALLFQKKVGEILREKRAALASDQLLVFSEAFKRFKDRYLG